LGIIDGRGLVNVLTRWLATDPGDPPTLRNQIAVMQFPLGRPGSGSGTAPALGAQEHDPAQARDDPAVA
jgi:hypothetical protein